MKKFAKVLVLTSICNILFIFLGGAISPEWKLVSRVSGTVESLRANETDWLEIIAQKFLKDGDKARTLENSRAKIQLADQSVVTIGSNTTVEIARFQLREDKRIVEFKMGIGRIKAQVSKFLQGESTFRVNTTKAVLAAKGTEFYVEAQNITLNQSNSLSNLISYNNEGPLHDVGLASNLPDGETVFISVNEGVVEATTDKGSQTFLAGDSGIIDSDGTIYINPLSIPSVFTNGPGWHGDKDLREPEMLQATATGQPSTAPSVAPEGTSSLPPLTPALIPFQESTGNIHINIRSSLRSFSQNPSFISPPVVIKQIVPSVPNSIQNNIPTK